MTMPAQRLRGWDAADPVHPTIEEVTEGPIIDPGTSVAESLEKKPIPMWVWLLGGGVLAYFLFFRRK